MKSRIYARKKSTREQTPDFSTAPAQPMFQSRPFVVQPPMAEHSQQPDLKTSLRQAQRYGHHLSRMQPTGSSAPKAVQPMLSAKTPQVLQAKLTVGEPGDMYEQEADEVADRVVDRIQEGGERSPAREPAQSQFIQQRKPKKSSQPLGLNIQPLVQMESAGGVQDAKPNLEQAIEQKRGGGQPLSNNIRKPMEREFGANFGGVKVHTDAQSDQLNRSIQAKAFTTGQNIFFRQEAYNPVSRGGQELIAHELTHVVQQNSSTVQRKPAVNPSTQVQAALTIPIQRMMIAPNGGKRPSGNGSGRKRVTNNSAAQGQSQGTRAGSSSTGGPTTTPTGQSNQSQNQPGKGKHRASQSSGNRTKSSSTGGPTTTPTGQSNQSQRFLGHYQVNQAPKMLGDEPVSSPITAGKKPNLPPNQPKDNIGYVINMASVPGELTPEAIADKYYKQGFDNQADAQNRLGMVIGVNKYKSLSGESTQAVQNHMQKVGDPAFRLGVFGFTWKLNWIEKTANRTVDFGTLQQEYNQLSGEEQQEVLAEEKAALKQATIPYGLIREKVTASPYTKNFVNELAEYNEHVYIHLGDADAISLKAPEGQPEQYSQQSTQNQPKSLFSRYDKILKENDHPLMAIGGYDFRFKDEKSNDPKATGDLDPKDPEDHLAYLANQLDQIVRTAIASVKPEAVYPTEPNLVFKAQGPNKTNKLFDLSLFESDGKLKEEGKLFGTGSREGRKLQNNLLGAMNKTPGYTNNNKITYAPSASIATDSNRFTLRADDKVEHGLTGRTETYNDVRNIASQNGINKSSFTAGANSRNNESKLLGDQNYTADNKSGLKARIIEDLITQAQSFVDPTDFTREVGEALEVKRNKNPQQYSDIKTKYSGGIRDKIYEKIKTRISDLDIIKNQSQQAMDQPGKNSSGKTKSERNPDADETFDKIMDKIKETLDNPQYEWLWNELAKKISEIEEQHNRKNEPKPNSSEEKNVKELGRK